MSESNWISIGSWRSSSFYLQRLCDLLDVIDIRRIDIVSRLKEVQRVLNSSFPPEDQALQETRNTRLILLTFPRLEPFWDRSPYFQVIRVLVVPVRFRQFLVNQDFTGPVLVPRVMPMQQPIVALYRRHFWRCSNKQRGSRYSFLLTADKGTVSTST